MDLYIYILLLISYAALPFFSLNSKQNFPYANVLFIVTVGLFYDNLILAFGRFIGESALLETLSICRYWLHAFVTPTLVLFSYGVIRKTALHWAKSRIFHLVAWIYMLLLILIELITVTLHLNVTPVFKYGVLHYVQETETGIPYMIIGTVLSVLLASIIVWWKEGWKWMLIGTIVMLIGNAIPLPFSSSAKMNVFEFLFIASLWGTKTKI